MKLYRDFWIGRSTGAHTPNTSTERKVTDMSNLNGFNANEVDPALDFEPIPAGKYLAIISASEMKPTKPCDGSYLELQFHVIEGEYKGRLLRCGST